MANTLDKYELLGYTIELVDIMDFLQYYNAEINNFSAYSKSAFLKSIFIPAPYFLEQPEETQKELLDNKVNFLKDHEFKYDKYCVVVWKEGTSILNCARAVYNEAIANYEFISSISNIQTSFVDRVYIKDGVVSLFNSSDVAEGKVNAGSIINVNMLLNKPSEVFKATCELPKRDAEVEANKYEYVDEPLDVTAYQHIELAVTDVEEEEVRNSYDNIVTKLNEGTEYLTYELDRVMLEFVKDKKMSEALARKIFKYIEKKQDGVTDITKENLLNYILAFDSSLRRIKDVNKLRSIPLSLINVLERLNKKEDE